MAAPAYLLVLAAAVAPATALAEEGVVMACRTHWQAEPDDSAGVPEHFFNAPLVGTQLSWRPLVAPSSKAVIQVAYELEVWDGHSNASAPLWASGKVYTAAQTMVLNSWAALKPDQTYGWRVRVYLSSAPTTPTQWGCGNASTHALFDTAPAASVFPGKNLWVGGGGQLRSKQPIDLPAGKVMRARAFVTGVGAFYLYVNGEKVGLNVMDPPQTVYSKTILYNTFDVGSLLKPGQQNHIGVLLGTYKWGYTDQWANMTQAGGPDGMRAAMLAVYVMMEDGTTHSINTESPLSWEARTGPVVWDHFFHGETFDGSLDPEWSKTGSDSQRLPSGRASAQAWSDAREISPAATAPTGMQVIGADGVAVALGEVKPMVSPPLRVTGTFPAVSVVDVEARDTGSSKVFDFGQNMAGMVMLSLPANHGLKAGTVLRIEMAEIVQGKQLDVGNMCKLCPKCGSCGGGPGASGPGGAGSCDARGQGAVCDTYCTNPALGSPDAAGQRPPPGADNHTLRHEPCYPHQSYVPGYPAHGIPAHETADRYIGDFNNANQTNLYTVRGDGTAESYTALFAGAGFRYAQLSGFPHGWDVPAGTEGGINSVLTGLRVHSNVQPISTIRLPKTTGSTFGTADVLAKIHKMTAASQSSNLWSIPTDCPQRSEF